MTDKKPKISVNDLNLFYGAFHALKNVRMEIAENRITAIIGPSGCGKSTLLRTFNRMNDYIKSVNITGQIVVDGTDIFDQSADVDSIRKRIGMVFQRPNAFPLSVYSNVTFGPSIHKMAKDRGMDEIVESSLKAVNLWNELKDKLRTSALNLSLEQRQRLCIARLIAVKPEVLLMDEPCSALDPVATLKIEDLLIELKEKYTIVIVTHNMQQAARVSDDTGFMLLGELLEFDRTQKIFTDPKNNRTEEYISGRFG